MCQPGYKLTKDFGGGNIQCTACDTNEVCYFPIWLLQRKNCATIGILDIKLEGILMIIDIDFLLTFLSAKIVMKSQMWEI